jgi:hypothetical protein
VGNLNGHLQKTILPPPRNLLSPVVQLRTAAVLNSNTAQDKLLRIEDKKMELQGSGVRPTYLPLTLQADFKIKV